MKNYEELRPRSRIELDSDLKSGNPEIIGPALITAALHDGDRGYLESTLETFLEHEDPWVRGVAATAVGHVVRIHRRLESHRIVPLIRALLLNPNTEGKAQAALDDIRMFMSKR